MASTALRWESLRFETADGVSLGANAPSDLSGKLWDQFSSGMLGHYSAGIWDHINDYVDHYLSNDFTNELYKASFVALCLLLALAACASSRRRPSAGS